MPSRMPNTTPSRRKMRQSSSVWFQCASTDRTSPAIASSAPSLRMGGPSVAAIAHLVFGGLSEARHGAGYPVGGPGDQLLGVDDRQAEQPDRLRGIGEPRRRLLLAGQHR